MSNSDTVHQNSHSGFEWLASHEFTLRLESFDLRLEARRTVDLLPEERIILSYLEALGGRVPAQVLGAALGFALTDEPARRQYRDEGEAALWREILGRLREYGLVQLRKGERSQVSAQEDDVQLTGFGRYALATGVKYEYFTSTGRLWRFDGLASPPDFPFERLDRQATLQGERVQPHPGILDAELYPAAAGSGGQAESATETTGVGSDALNDLLRRARYQVAATDGWPDVEILHVSTGDSARYPQAASHRLRGEVYRMAGCPPDEDATNYHIVPLLGAATFGELEAVLADAASADYRMQVGHDAEFAVWQASPGLRCGLRTLRRFAADWDDATLLADPRLAWDEAGVIDELQRRAVAAGLRARLAKYIPLPVLMMAFEEYRLAWAWPEVSRRLPDDFIGANLTPELDGAPRYPWDFEVLSARPVEVVEGWLTQLLASPWAEQLHDADTFNWHWADLAARLSEGFVLRNLNRLPFSRSVLLTRGGEFVRAAVLTELADGNPSRWSRDQLLDALGVEFTWEHLPRLGPYVAWRPLLVALLSAGTPPADFSLDRLFALVEPHKEEINPFATEALRWTPDMIRRLDALDLLHWPSSTFSAGFDAHPAVAWDSDHFRDYHSKIQTARGRAYVSSHITDVSLVRQYPEFAWDWEALSANPNLTWTRELTTQFREKIVWSKLLWRFGSDVVAQRLPELHQQLTSYGAEPLADLWAYANAALDVATLLGLRGAYDEFLDLSQLSRRDPAAVAAELVRTGDFVADWDWAALGQGVPIDALPGLLEKAALRQLAVGGERIAALTLPAAARLPLAFSLEKAPLLGLPWDWEYVSRHLTVVDLTKHLRALTPHLNWDYLARQEQMRPLLREQWLDDPLVGERLPWEYVLNECFAPAELMANLPVWAGRFARFQSAERRAGAWRALTRRLPVEAIIPVTDEAPGLSVEILVALDWEYLSASTRLSHRLTLPVLRRYEAYWHWPALSRNPNLNASPQYLLDIALRRRWDWSWISEYSRFIKPFEQYGDIRNVLWKYANFINWRAFSRRVDLPMPGELLYDYGGRDWDWTALSACPKLALNDRTLHQLRAKPWDWRTLSANRGLDINMATLATLAGEEWDWAALSANRGVALDHDGLVALAHHSWDWRALTRRNDLRWDAALVRRLADYDLDWARISGWRKEIEWTADFLHDFRDRLDWKSLSERPPLHLTADLLRRFRDKWNFETLARGPLVAGGEEEPNSWILAQTCELPWNWHLLSEREDVVLTDAVLDELVEQLHWPTLSRRAWGDAFRPGWLNRYRQYWDLIALAFNDHLPGQVRAEVKAVIDSDQTRVFPYLYALQKHRSLWAGYAFHCTHLTNAAAIIRSGELLSRRQVLRTGHKLADASGSIVNRREDAHQYARLYYRPQTFTQFYTEQLGIDNKSHLNPKNGDNHHYYAAESLGFPKCPVPVYFRFRVAEVIKAAKEGFTISDGNMQRNATRYGPLQEMYYAFYSGPLLFHRQSVWIDDPSEWNQFKDVSQQEMLIRDKLALGSLETVDVYVMSQWAKDELVRLIGAGHPLVPRIHVDPAGDCFHGENRPINCRYAAGELVVTTEFADAHELVIYCHDLAQIADVHMPAGAYRVKGHEVIAEGRIHLTMKEGAHFRVAFRDKVVGRPGGAREYDLYFSHAEDVTVGGKRAVAEA